jgi:hypothetical protein
VNSGGDAADSRINGVCATTTGVCTLRAALQEANAISGPVTVAFAIPGSTPAVIQTTAALPPMTNPNGITVDGYSAPGSQPNTAVHGSNARISVEVRGGGAALHNGFQLAGPNNVIRGLAIFNFKSSIRLYGQATRNNSIVGNFVCTNASATFAAPALDAGASGITIIDAANNNSIGVAADHVTGTAADVADRNIISGCAHRGVIVTFTGAVKNRVQNNVVGLTPDGSAALANRSHGVDVNYGAQDTLIGGYGPGEGNVLSGNRQSGAEVSHGSSNRRNNVIGNFIGTNLTGTAAPAYAANGVDLKPSLRLEGEKTCAPCAPNAGFSLVENNVIVGGPSGGVMIDKGQQRNIVRNNWIGLLPNGTPAGNQKYAVRLEQGAINNTIGPGNVIAYNGNGIQMQASASDPPNSYRLAVTGNRITRNVMFGNSRLGIDLAPWNQVNVNGVGDPDVQGKIQAPSVTGLTAQSATVAACAGCTVEVFASEQTSVSTAFTLENYGEAAEFLGSGVANASGTAVVSLNRPLVSGTTVVTATATDAAGNTSEFSKNRLFR